LDWLSDDNRAGLSDGKDECTPAIRNRAADGYPERVRVAPLEYPLAETLGGTAKPGWSLGNDDEECSVPVELAEVQTRLFS